MRKTNTDIKQMESASKSGKLWLVGAGPGDPDLLTVKALRVIQSAELILFDHLVSDEIKALFPASVPAFYVGKEKNNHSIAQKDLNSLLIKKANEGKVVVRIKGGDPFVFGRGAEELLALTEAGVDAEVVPGITAASGCTTAANIPLTHRGLVQGCSFITAHAEKTLDVNWQALAQLNHTLVFYMGVSKADTIQEQLSLAGMNQNTPVAIIENGCRHDQRELIGSLAELSQMVVDGCVKSPALIVVGDTVSVAEDIRRNFDKYTDQSFIENRFMQNKCA